MGNKHREVKSVMVLSPRFAAPGTLSPEPAGPPRGCRSLISGRQRSLGDSSATVTTLHSRGAGLRRRGGGGWGPSLPHPSVLRKVGGGLQPSHPPGSPRGPAPPPPPSFWGCSKDAPWDPRSPARPVWTTVGGPTGGPGSSRRRHSSAECAVRPARRPLPTSGFGNENQ